MKEIIAQHPIIAILRGVPLQHTLDYARTAFEGGIAAFEVALNSEHALRQIELLAGHFGPNAVVGAGTVTTVQRARAALAAGASFLLSPSANGEVLDYCAQNRVKLLPGVMTPTDVSVCVNSGFTVLKLFPAGDLPATYLRSLQGPFEDTEYVAVGGVGPENLTEFFAAGYIGVGIGSSLIPQALQCGDSWDKARIRIAGMVAEASKARLGTK